MIDLVFKTIIITNINFHRYNQNTNLNVHTYYLTIREKSKTRSNHYWFQLQEIQPKEDIVTYLPVAVSIIIYSTRL